MEQFLFVVLMVVFGCAIVLPNKNWDESPLMNWLKGKRNQTVAQPEVKPVSAAKHHLDIDQLYLGAMLLRLLSTMREGQQIATVVRSGKTLQFGLRGKTFIPYFTFKRGRLYDLNNKAVAWMNADGFMGIEDSLLDKLLSLDTPTGVALRTINRPVEVDDYPVEPEWMVS